MTIYDPSGVVVYEAPITTSATIKRQLMGDYYIELVFDAVDRIGVGRGCYILYNNHRFEIMSNVIPDDTSQGGLRYTLRFEAQQSQMKRCKVFWREGENLEVSFALTSDISTFGQLIIDNVNAFLGGSTFTLGSVPSNTEMKAISFAGDSCWDAVATIAETFGVEWWTEDDGDNVRLCFGKLETGDSVEFRKGDIVSSIPSKKGDDASYGTRFYVFGSTKNLPTDYGTTVEGGVTNNVVEKRLHLPNGQQYIDAWPNLAPEDVVEQVVFFDDVMPTNVETITDIHEAVEEVIPGTSNRVYYAICADSPFGYENIIEGEQMQANFTSGDLIGQTFDLEIDTTAESFNKTFRIVPKVTDKDALEVIPNANMRPRVGDSFILVGVELPQARVEQAENELLAVGTEYSQKNSNDTEIYDCPTNAVYCHRNDCNYALGQRVTLVDEKFGDTGRQSRIQGYEKKLYDEYQAIYTVGDNSPYSRLASLEKAIQRASYGDRVGLEVNIIRSKADSTIPSDYNVYSALASEEIFLSKRKGGKVKGHTDFEKGISMYGIPWEYDVERDAWTINGNVIITKGLATYSALKEDDVLSVFDGLPIDSRTIVWNNGVLEVNQDMIGGLDEDALKDYLDANKYTTQTWINEQKYVTESWVTGKNYALQSSLTDVDNRLKSVETFFATDDTDSYVNKWDEIVTFLNAVEGDTLDDILSTKFDKADFTYSNIKSTLGIYSWALASSKPSYAFSEITSKPTTLSGYGISNAYTKTEVEDNFLALTGGQLSGNLEVYKSTAYIWANNNGANSIGLRAGYDVGLRHRNSSNVEQWALAVANSGSGMWTRFPLAVNMSVDEPRSAYSLYVNGDSYTTGTFYLNGAPLTYNSSKNAWQLEGNLIVTGGLATYTKLSGFTNLDVMGGVVVDGTTIAIVDGALKYIGETSGGGSVSITGAASTIVSSNLTASRALISNSSGKVAVSAVTSTELGYLDGVTSAIQTQLNNKQATLVSGTNIKTINGTSILGSGDITISGGSGDVDLLNTENIEPASNMTYNVGSASYVYNTGYFQNIQPYRAYALRVYTAASSSSSFVERLRVGASGKITVALTSDSQAKEIFNVVGNIYTTGTVTESSARKMKDVDYEGEGVGLDVLKKVKVVKWHWKDKRDKRMHIGAIAEDLAEIIPEAVFDTEADDGSTTPSIAYGKAGFSIAASLIAPVVRHEDRIKELEKNIEKMQKELNQLRKTA